MKKLNKLLVGIICILLINILAFPMFTMVQAKEKEIVIVLDPGHGGKMSGAVNFDIKEKDINLKIARYLRDYLNKYEGIRVLMTHNGLPNDVDLELNKRGMFARNNNADMVISIHMNASTNERENGTEVYVTANNSLPKYYQESSKLAEKIINNITKLGVRNRGIKTRLCQDSGDKWMYSDGSKADYYGIIRYSMKGEGDGIGANIANGEGVPAIIIEHCFLRGWDIQFYNTEEKIKKLAEADGQAIVEHYGLCEKGTAVKTRLDDTIKNIGSAMETYIRTEKTKQQLTLEECKNIKDNIMQKAKKFNSGK